MAKNVEKDTALEQVLADIEKQFGKGAIMKLGEQEHKEIEVSPSGSLSLDIALGAGGYPKGRIIEIYGPESSGKTTFALHAIAEVQKNGGRAAFIDAEHSLDPVYAHNLGVNTDELLLSQPDTGEQALEICDVLVKSEAVSIIVIDSVAALVPQAEIDGEMGDNHIGLQARLMSQALRKLTGSIKKSNCVAIFINQLREKVGIIGRVHPSLLKDEVYVCELSLTKLNKEVKPLKYKESSKYPEIIKDVAFIVPKSLTSGEIVETIKKAGGRLLSSIDVFDVYTGENVKENEKSIAYTLTFKDDTRTLNDEEVNAVFRNIIDKVIEKFNVELRDK